MWLIFLRLWMFKQGKWKGLKMKKKKTLILMIISIIFLSSLLSGCALPLPGKINAEVKVADTVSKGETEPKVEKKATYPVPLIKETREEIVKIIYNFSPKVEIENLPEGMKFQWLGAVLTTRKNKQDLSEELIIEFKYRISGEGLARADSIVTIYKGRKKVHSEQLNLFGLQEDEKPLGVGEIFETTAYYTSRKDGDSGFEGKVFDNIPDKIVFSITEVKFE